MTSRRSLLLHLPALFACLCLVATPLAVAAAEEPSQFVEAVIDDALDVLRLPPDDVGGRNAGFRTILNTNFDLETITRLVVGRYWRQATPEQQKQFAAAFEDHIVNIYTSQLGAYQDEEVVIKRATARNERDTIVLTEVLRRDQDPLRVDWMVRMTDDGLKVIDVAAEGVSLMTTKRSEFTTVIARDGMEGLIDQLKELNAGTDAG